MNTILTIILVLVMANVFIGSADAALLSHYSFDNDLTTNSAGANGTIGATGGTVDTVNKRFGAGSYSSPAAGDYTSLPSITLSDDADGYTIAFWAKKANTGNTGMALGNRAGVTSWMWLNDGAAKLSVNFESTAGENLSYGNDTAWHHYALVVESGGSSVYIDGAISAATTLASDGNFVLSSIGTGWSGSGFEFQGNLDEVWVYNHALTSTEVNGLYLQNDVTYIAPPVPAAISSPTTRTIIQRTPANIGSIPVSGTYTGSAPDSFEARVIVTAGGGNSGTTSAWQTIDASPTGGTYSGTLTSIAAGGWYTLEVRSVMGETPSTAITLEKIGVGDIFIITGQSNAGSYGSPQATPVDDRVSRMTSIVSSSWAKASDPMNPPDGLGLDGSGGSAWTRLGDLLTATNNVPVGFVCIAVGGSGSFEWLPTTTYHTTRLRPAVQHFPSNGFRAILWHQGEGDAFYQATASLYATQMAQIIAESRTDAGWAVPWYVCEAAAVGGTNNFKGIPVLAGQRATVFADSNVFLGPTTNEFYLEQKTSDTTHFNAAGLLDHATQWRDILGENTVLDVENHDFERNVTPAITGTGALADGAFYTINHNAVGDPSILDWRELLASGVIKPDGSTGYYNPGSSQYTNAVDTTNGGVMANMDGKHVAYLSGGSAGNHYLQYRRKALLPNHTYTFTVALGVRDNGDTFGNAELKLLANGATLTNTTFTSSDLDTLQGGSATGKFTNAMVTHTTGSTTTANQPVGVQITKINGGGTTYLDIDNVRLTATPTAFGAWQITHFGSVLAANSGPDDDPDGDGRTNLYEFTYNSDPNDTNTTGVGQPMTFDGTTFTVTRRIASDAGISYILQESTTLLTDSWITVMNITENVISTSGNFEIVAITKTSGAWLTGDRSFLRLMAVLN